MKNNPVKKKEKKKVQPPKKDPRKVLISRLKLLDSVGKSNPVCSVGSLNRSVEPLREQSAPYEPNLTKDDKQNKSFDTISAKNIKNPRDTFRERSKVNASLPNNLELERAKNQNNLKDYTSVSTTITTIDKKILESN